MKYPYSVEYLELGSERFPIIQLPEGLELVTTFLVSDIQGPLSRTFFLEEINRVLQGKIPSSEVGGNVCALKINKDITTVIDGLADEPHDPKNQYVIETTELRSLILIWLGLQRRKPTKYLYRIEFLDTHLPIMYISEEMQLVTLFLFFEVQGSRDSAFFLGEIERVLQGEAPIAEAKGDSYTLEIQPDFTTVIDTWVEDPNDPQNRCVIETEELKTLLLSWADLQWCIQSERRTNMAAMLTRHTNLVLKMPTVPAEKLLSTRKYLPAEQLA